MVTKPFLIATCLCLVSFFSFSQNFQKQFKDLFEKKDTLGQEKLLKQWEAAAPKDAELFIAYLNFYSRKSMREIVELNSKKKDGDYLELTDSTGKTVATMGSDIYYDRNILQKGFGYIDRGISLYPTRLDMRFGKIYMLGEVEDFPEFTKMIVETIDYGNKIKNAWLWKDARPLEDAENFFLNSMQDYVITIYNTEDDNLLPYMRQISEAVLKYHPRHVESLANVSLTYVLVGENDKALPYLLKAETIAPKDIIVLNNIAEIYKRKNDTAKAKSYYEKIIKWGNAEEVEEAKAKLKELK